MTHKPVQTPSVDELRPCPNPWCAYNDPVVERTLRHMGDNSPNRVECECGMCGPVKPTEAEAIAAWNTRPELDTRAARVAELVEALAPLTRCRPHKSENGLHTVQVSATVAEIRRARALLPNASEVSNG